MFRRFQNRFTEAYYETSRAIRTSRWSDFIPFFLRPSFYSALLTYPFVWFFAVWPQRKMRSLLLGLPAVTVFTGVLSAVHMVRQEQPGLATVYWESAQDAAKKRDYPLAEMLLNRVLYMSRSHVDDAKYLLASVYEETGNLDRAEVILRSLAPDDRQGYRPAHKRLAWLFAQEISAESPEEDVSRLKWHLDASSDEQSPIMALAWGRYSIAIQNLEKARSYMEIAVAEFPELWVTLGEINLQLNDNDRALVSYEKASQFLSKQLETHKKDRAVRADYATVLMRLGRLDEARGVLEEGLKTDPEGQWNAFLADLYVNYCDLLSLQGKGNVSDLLAPLALALEHDPNHIPALQRLMSFATATVEGNADIKALLARVVAEAKVPALAHLALGNVYAKEGDTEAARFHFELALDNDKTSKLPVVMNNLGWLIAHDPDSPDLKRALELSSTALAASPENEEFLDTRGTIYLKMGEYRSSLKDLEQSLGTMTRMLPSIGNSPVLQAKIADLHLKIATVYDHLKRPEMAESHRSLEQAARQAAGDGVR